jgi:DNA-nicking Smr family endonuclease
VHSILAKHPDVISFTLDHPEYGGWGATIVCLGKK